jgi:hypothetical protein
MTEDRLVHLKRLSTIQMSSDVRSDGRSEYLQGLLLGYKLMKSVRWWVSWFYCRSSLLGRERDDTSGRSRLLFTPLNALCGSITGVPSRTLAQTTSTSRPRGTRETWCLGPKGN